jgi:beta-ribofuranosylaminobenzene 5'-phosphate synthase
VNYDAVTVIAPARLHMGFIDLSGALGRHFGSIGVGLHEIATRVTVTAAEQLTVVGPNQARALASSQQLCQRLGVSDGLAISIESVIPEHIGLGSGTQLALALGMAISHFYQLDVSVRAIAQLTDRGARSGIGIGVFEQGGLVVDGGRGAATTTPPVLSRLPVPEAWRFIVVFDARGQGLHGAQELAAFAQLPAFPRQQAEQLSYLLLMQALPALAEGDLAAFGAVITALQTAVGEHFAPVQGGVFTSAAVAEVMAYLAAQGAVGVGQTSWGPTGFCMVDSPEKAEALQQAASQRFAGSGVEVVVVSARNQGAEIILSR